MLDLGAQPPANILCEKPNSPYVSHPLGLLSCMQCGHGQLSYFVAPEELFRSYSYASGTSGTLGAYFDWFSAEALRCFGKGAGVLEIACNDGSLLKRMTRCGLTTLGVDPAENLVSQARSEGLDVIAEFWPRPGLLTGRSFDLIVAMNVLAHNTNPLEFLVAVADALEDDGACLIQTSQVNMLVNGEFDTIYHEHYSFFTVRSLATLARRAGLELRQVNLVDVHGTSLAAILTKPSCQRDLASFLKSPPFAVSQGKTPLAERIDGTPEQYDTFGTAARERMETVRTVVAEHRAVGHRICFVGAAAKALTFLRAAEIVPDHVFDEAQLKIGRHIPGQDKAIEPLDAIGAIPGTVFVVLSAWNFRKELVRKVREKRPNGSMIFMAYFPEVEVFI